MELVHPNGKRSVLNWLYTGMAMIFIMVAIGGITRLTESGLSITTWDPISGAIPPLKAEDWNQLFEKYKSSPEYIHKNIGMSLSEFKSIFWWEWFHRQWGRLIGIVFLIPFVLFWRRGYFKSGIRPHLLGIFVLGGLQAFFGWYMVHSGLVHEPRVSHYRLALHLSTAFASISWIWWLALSIRGKVVAYRPPELNPWLYGSAVLLVLQIILGAFTAGKDAGHASDQWPMWVDGQFTPSTNDFELNWLWNNESWIQFVHRSFAYLVVLSFITTAWKAHGLRWRHPAIGAMPWIILLQFLLGVLTVMSGVNLSLALLHQLLALLLLLAVVYALHPGKRGIK